MEKDEMDAIMQERIDKFNNFVMEQDIDKMPVGLFSGKMGICIYFYHQARITQNKVYEKFAGKLLDSIYSQVHTEMPIDLENGLVGICFGINYLIEKNFVQGNVNSILKELDDRIFRFLNFTYLSNNLNNQIDDLRVMLGVSFYFSKRLESYQLSVNESYIFKNIIIKSINKIENTNLPDKFTEPHFFSITNYFFPLYLIFLSKIYNQDFFNYKIEKIFDEISNKLKSTYPLLKCNRLFLSIGIECIINIKDMDGWKDHIKLLEQDIDTSMIITEEFRNKNILANDGLSGFYFLMSDLHKEFILDELLIAEKITSSDFWIQLNNIEENNNKIPLGLVTGFTGVVLAYQKCIKKLSR